jgi:hypothetical protein
MIVASLDRSLAPNPVSGTSCIQQRRTEKHHQTVTTLKSVVNEYNLSGRFNISLHRIQFRCSEVHGGLEHRSSLSDLR